MALVTSKVSPSFGINYFWYRVNCSFFKVRAAFFCLFRFSWGIFYKWKQTLPWDALPKYNWCLVFALMFGHYQMLMLKNCVWCMGNTLGAAREPFWSFHKSLEPLLELRFEFQKCPCSELFRSQWDLYKWCWNGGTELWLCSIANEENGKLLRGERSAPKIFYGCSR